MLAKHGRIFLSMLIAFGLFLPATAQRVEAKKKTCFITRLKRKIKRKVKHAIKKTRRGIYKVGAGITNKVMDTAIKAKVCITGKKNKYTWVKGHYKTGNKHHTGGHFRRISHKKRSSGGGAAAAGGDSFAPADTADAPLPFDDPATGEPAFSDPAADAGDTFSDPIAAAPADEAAPEITNSDPVLPSGDDFSFDDDFKYSLKQAADAKAKE